MQFRSIVAAAGLAVAACGTASAADSQFLPMQVYGSPFVGDLTGILGTSLNGGSDSWGSIGGRFAVPIHNGWTLAPEFFSEMEDDGYAFITAVAHFYRKTPTFAHGFFVGYSHDNDSGDDVAVGIEGAWYTHPSSILSASGFIAHDSYGGWVNVTGAWDYFFNPDTKLTLLGSLEIYDGGTDPYGQIRLTHRFTGTQLSGFIAAEATDYWRGAFVGLTFNFDQPGTSQYMHDVMLPFSTAPAL
jgi:hypothetical protein